MKLPRYLYYGIIILYINTVALIYICIFSDGTFSRLQVEKWKTDFCLQLRCHEKEEYSEVNSNNSELEDRVIDSPVYSCKFNAINNLLALAYEDGRLIIQQIENRKSSFLIGKY